MLMIQISELLLKNNDAEIFLAIQKERQFSFDSFIWGYHVYKETWTPKFEDNSLGL